MPALQGTIAVVTGASRGAGRGIALELGCAGATVYVTGRTTRTAQPTRYDAFRAQAELAKMPRWRDVPPLSRTESPRYIGRAVVALAADTNVHTKSGGVHSVGDLAAEYAFTDIDGRVIPPFELE